ncbi:MAG: hypothetical protein RBR71_14305 [Gudongella sp.]|nr:hypothetical protein [Gudongella sp.]
MVGTEQLKRRLAAVEDTVGRRSADIDVARIIDERTAAMLAALEHGEEYDTSGDEDLIWLWTEIKKVWCLVPDIRW